MAQPKTSPKEKKKLNVWMIVAICAIVLLIAAIEIILLTRDKGLAEKESDKHETTDFVEVVGEDTLVAEPVSQQNVNPEISKDHTKISKPSKGEVNGHQWVDMGLPSGTKWALVNLGAYSESDSGEYFTWGSVYSGAYQSYATTNSVICGNINYDAATYNWGGGWRLPTSAQYKELIKHCKWKWTVSNGVQGYRVTASNGNSLFFPCAGYIKDGLMEYYGTNGNYWTGTPNTNKPLNAYYLSFSDSYREVRQYDRDRARSVRAVLK